MEQWKRGQGTLFGRFRHVDSRGDRPCRDGHLRLVNLPEDWSRRLDDDDVAALRVLADSLDLPETMAFFRDLDLGDAGLTPRQAGALRAMKAAVNARFGCPEWREDAVIQLHLDTRCVRGGLPVLKAACHHLTAGLLATRDTEASLEIAAPVARGPGLPLTFRLPAALARDYADRSDQMMGSLGVELGPEGVRLRGVIARPPDTPSPLGRHVVLGEDFGYANTSSMVVARSAVPVGQEVMEFLATDPGKKAVRGRLATHVSGEDVEILETLQMSGRNFLDCVKAHAERVDGLRSEIDRCYNRLYRLRAELNTLACRDPGDPVPPEPEACEVGESERGRYLSMHGRFFRLLKGIGRLKARRRDVYRKVAAVKAVWLGHVANRKVALAEKHDAMVVSEDLTVVAIPTDDPKYRGRTFNKMLNNGAKGQYIRRSRNKLNWRGIAT